MSLRLIDTAADVRPALPRLAQAGIVGVGRYYCDTTDMIGKLLTLTEAKAITAAGLDVVSLYENGPATTAAYFTTGHGLRDARVADARARSALQPLVAPIYFVVDLDTTPEQLPRVTDYFGALRDAHVAGDLGYPIGVYGSGFVCQSLRTLGVVDPWAWLARAKDWRGSATFTDWTIEQGPVDAALGADAGGLPLDRTDGDVAIAAYGGWRVPLSLS